MIIFLTKRHYNKITTRKKRESYKKLILPKKYIDEIDIIELKKRQLRNTKQRNSVEEAYQKYKKIMNIFIIKKQENI